MLRISRVLRMLRAVKMFKELRALLFSLVGCVGPTLFWSMIMLIFILHVFGLFYVQEMTLFLKKKAEEGDVDEETTSIILSNFGSVSAGMITLWKSSTGGEDWGYFYNLILQELGVFHAGVFVSFIWFFQGAIFNVLTGIFVNEAIRQADKEQDKKERLHQEMQEEAEQLQQMIKMCENCKLDKDNDGRVSLFEFLELSKNPGFVKLMEMQGLQLKNPKSFFRMLTEITGKDSFRLEEFAKMCQALKGQATALAVHELSVEILCLFKTQHRFHNHVRSSFEALETQIEGLAQGGLEGSRIVREDSTGLLKSENSRSCVFTAVKAPPALSL